MTQAGINRIVNEWRIYYKRIGLQKQIIEVYIEYVTKLLTNNVAIIFDLEHLRSLLGLKSEYLLSIINGPESHYRTFDIKKRSGGTREISAPYYALKTVQKWIYYNILENVPVHRCCHGFRHNKSIITNVKIHEKEIELLKLDLRDFFPSIGKNKVVKIFQDLGYVKDVAYYLASICCYDEHLPQGAPTSPILSNIVARSMDNRLFNLAKKYKYKYTRYADDIAFSGDRISPQFISYVRDIINECGFELNDKKVRLYRDNGNKILTGISLRNGEIHLPRDKKRELEKDVYYIMKYGFYSHVEKNQIRNINYLQSMIGKVNFWLTVEPENEIARNAYSYLSSLYYQTIGVKND